MIAAVLALAVPAGNVPQTKFELFEMRRAIAPADRVGARKAGLLCLPAGALRWSDIDPGSDAINRAVARGFSTGGVRDPFTVPSSATFKVSGEIVGVDVSACLAETGLKRKLGGRKTSKVSGAISVRWRVFDIASQRVVYDQTSISPFEATGGNASAQDQVAAVIERSAREVAHKVAP